MYKTQSQWSYTTNLPVYLTIQLISHLSARSIVTSDQMLSAMPKQSNPGPMLALVAGTLTTTRLRSIAASLQVVRFETAENNSI